jgi:hypothetical protein
MTTPTENPSRILRWMSASYTLTEWRAGTNGAAQVIVPRCAMLCGGLLRRRITSVHANNLGSKQQEPRRRTTAELPLLLRRKHAASCWQLQAERVCQRLAVQRARGKLREHVRMQAYLFRVNSLAGTVGASDERAHCGHESEQACCKAVGSTQNQEPHL